MIDSIVTYDHSHIYIQGERWIPEKAKYIVLSIPLWAEGSILDGIVQQACDAEAQQRKIFWEIDFQWGQKPLFVNDSSYFFSLGLWLQEMSETLFIPWAKSSLAIIVFRGDIDLSSYIVWSEEQEILYRERVDAFPSQTSTVIKQVFTTDLLGEYLQRLCSFLPDSLPGIVFLDASSCSRLSLLSYCVLEGRWEHLLVALKGSPLPLGVFSWREDGSLVSCESEVNLGVCLPSLERGDLAEIESVLAQLLSQGRPFRLIPEDKLHEMWDGIDELIVFSDKLSPQGKRKLQGFQVTEGKIIEVKNKSE